MLIMMSMALTAGDETGKKIGSSGIEKANFNNSASFTQRMNHILYVIVLCYMVLKDTKE